MTKADQRALLDWFHREKRDMPWRLTRDPYAIWVSEVMLQQTQVATVIPYFERWMTTFPSVEVLASAPEQEVLRLWAGLGYYRRARLLHAGAKYVAVTGWPVNAAEWLKVPGVGRYTAGAIASIALGEATPVVDGNVERVFARLTNSQLSGLCLHKSCWEWALQVLVDDAPGNWNQALMELGATVCTPQKPSCLLCPLRQSCQALLAGTADQLPVPTKKPERKRLAFLVLVRASSEGAVLRQIQPGEWWEGMWEFERSPWPHAEPPGHEFVVKHVVTNHDITLYVQVSTPETTKTTSWEEVALLPLPAPQKRIVERVRRLLG